jgi:hypothetical protein
MKICSKCKIEKLESQFYKRINNRLYSCCKECYKINLKKYYKTHKSEIKKYKQVYQQTNKIKIRNKKQINYQINKYKILKRNKLYAQNKLKNNPYFRLIHNLRRRMLHALKGKNKSAHTQELLGCDINTLHQYLESKFQLGMTWENQGFHGWHVDHIRPCSSFNLSDPIQQRVCFHFTNLQPLWAEDNLKKSNKKPARLSTSGL